MDENLNSNGKQEGKDPTPEERDRGFWDDKSLMELFNRTTTLMRRYLHMRLHAHALGGDPHRGQGRVLSILKIKPDISQKDLGYLLDMRSQSLGELLMKLERSGYITRTPSEEDRRVMNIHLTELGRAAAEQAEKGQENGNKVFDCLSAEEQAQMSEYLKRMIIRMERALDTAYGTERSYDYDPFWGVGPFSEGVKDCCRHYKREMKEQSRAMRDEFRRQGRDLREHLRAHGHALREEMRRDPRLAGYFWGGADWMDDWDYDRGAHGGVWPEEPDDRGNGKGNGPRPE